MQANVTFRKGGLFKLITLLMCCCLAEDTYSKGKTLVILAGYEERIRAMMAKNAGLASRFTDWHTFNGERAWWYFSCMD